MPKQVNICQNQIIPPKFPQQNDQQFTFNKYQTVNKNVLNKNKNPFNNKKPKNQTQEILQQQQPTTQRSQSYLSIKNKFKIPFIYKLIISLLFIVGYTIYRIFYQKFDNSKCLVDKYFEATFQANRWLRNTQGGVVIIGIGQVMMDAWVLGLGIVWLILVKNMRFPIAAGIIFLFRSFFLNLEKLPFDDYIVWHSPGFLALTVPYDRTRDFFFSGHTSTLSIIMIQFFILKWPWVGVFAFFNLIFMMNMLIITRINYTIDIIAALIFTAVVYRLTFLIVKWIDYAFSIPFYIGRWSYQNIFKKERKGQYKSIENRVYTPQTEQQIRNMDVRGNM